MSYIRDSLARIRGARLVHSRYVRCRARAVRAATTRRQHVSLRSTKGRHQEVARPPARGLALAALMCLVVGGLGGLLAASLVRAPKVYARFTPPREPAQKIALRDQDGHLTTLHQARGKVVILTF